MSRVGNESTGKYKRGVCVCVCVHMRVCVHVEGVNGGRELTRKELTDGSA